MKLNSKYFDSIRVAPKRQRAEQAREERPCCQWKGCRSPGPLPRAEGAGARRPVLSFLHRSRARVQRLLQLLRRHERPEVEDFQKDALTGHRPTWKVGANLPGRQGTPAGAADGSAGPQPATLRARSARLLCLARAHGTRGTRRGAPHSASRSSARSLRGPQPDGTAQRASRSRLASRSWLSVHHPDANGGDKRSEDKLREIIQAYNYLKQAGLV